MRVAIVHHWFVSISGGERVVDALLRLFPEADIFTLFCDPKGLPSRAAGNRVTASFLNRIPGARRYHRHFLPLYPLAVESLDLTGYDLIISSDSGPVKGVITDPGAIHICYCHSPMRYLWDAHFTYTASQSRWGRLPFRVAAHYVRNWDYAAAQRVDHFIANSRYVAARIRKYYRRESCVIYPPVETRRAIATAPVGDAYLTVGRLIPYKRVDLLIEACNRLGRKLTVVGSGPELPALMRKAGPMINFRGQLEDGDLWDAYSRCRALLFAADEDFGIVPLEAQACGRPVIAYAKGGALETVVGVHPRPVEQSFPADAVSTGVLFRTQSVDSVCEAIEEFEAREGEFDSGKIRRHACNFDTDVFLDSITDYVNDVLKSRGYGGMLSAPCHLAAITPSESEPVVTKSWGKQAYSTNFEDAGGSCICPDS
jgi:glycosyltransferase involved in cell wall biosynthesis